jgi:calcium-dependent protein kinase
MSPERIQGSLENDIETFKKCDIWSCGVLLYTLIAGHPPFYGKSNDEIYQKICTGEFIFNGREWDLMPDAKDLIYHLL